ITAIVPIVAVASLSLHVATDEQGFQAPSKRAKKHGSSVKTLSLDEYGLPKKAEEENSYVEDAPATTSSAYNVGAEAKKGSASNEKPDEYEVSPIPENVEKEKSKEQKSNKSEDLDEYASPKKEKKDKSDDSYNKKDKKKSDDSGESTSHKKEKKEKSDESSSSKKKNKEKSIESDESGSPRKGKKEKSDDSDESSSSKKKKKDKADGSDEYASLEKEKKEKSEGSDKYDYESPKKEKNEKSVDANASAYFKKENGNEEKPDEDAAPVDVSTTGEYVSPQEKSDEDAMPADVSLTGQYVSSTKAPATSDAYAAPKQQVASSQPMGGAPDELPPAAKSTTTTTTGGAYASPKSSQDDASGSQPTKSSAGGAYNDASPRNAATNKPKLSMESFSGMIKRPIVKMLSPVIKSVCAKTEYPADCEASIAGLRGAAPAQTTDTLGVLKLAMEAVRQKAVEAMNAATDRMNAPGADATTKEALDSCTSSYSDIKTSLDTVDDALRRGDVDTAHTNLDSVETDVTTCDDGFQERGTPSVMTDHDQELQKLASNLLSIGAVLH
ncbi:hypothetical protein BS78_K202300, partial [Paspalum vaginatum]